jgi:hypothetical protein
MVISPARKNGEPPLRAFAPVATHRNRAAGVAAALEPVAQSSSLYAGFAKFPMVTPDTGQ